MWRDISELRPGTVLSLPGERVSSYWEPAEHEAPDLTLEAWGARLREILEAGVRSRLSGAESVGVYLSGGIDSTLITGLVAKHHAGPVHTYSLHFGPQYRNELEFSNLAAREFGTIHHTLEVTPKEVAANLEATMAALDDPIGDPLTVPNFLMGRAAAQDVQVIFNGEGGDPCFGGPKNQPMLLHEIYPSAERRESAYLRTFQKCYADLPQLLRPEIKRALEDVTQEKLLRPFFETDRMTSYLNRLMYMNVRLKGADHILTKVQNLTRANGLSAHSPLFDRNVVDLSFAIPPRFKLSSTEEKVVLKAAVSDFVPPAIVQRPKSGMMVPVQGWFRHELKQFARHTLWDDVFSVHNLAPRGRDAWVWRFLDKKYARRWLDYEGPDRHGLKLWMLLSLEFWLRAHKPE
jgi:asparagine synthase (glutamine-hydrolysing)